MNWNEIITQLIIGFVGILISSLSIFITHLINKWVKDQDLKNIIYSLNEVVRNAVLEVYQTYVEELKANQDFSFEAQKIALNRALELIKANLPEKVFEWLKTNFKDYEGYLKSLIEAQIGALKNSGGK